MRSEADLAETWPRGWGELQAKGQLELVAVDDASGRRFTLRIFDSYVLRETAEADFDNGDEVSLLIGNILVVPSLTLEAVREVIAQLVPEDLLPDATCDTQ